MMKRFFTRGCVLFGVMALLGMAGCDKAVDEVRGLLGGSEDSEGSDASEREANALKLGRNTTYYNDYLGVSYTIPKNWWTYAITAENVSEEAGDITGESVMDLYYDENSYGEYATVWMLEFANLRHSTADNHLGFDVSAQSFAAFRDIAAYMEYYQAYWLESEEDTEYRLEASEKLALAGREFELRDYLVDRGGDNFKVMTLTTPVKNNYFLNITVDYWPDNKNARKTVIDALAKGLKFL
ncbi:MAG: hypothetical protein LBB82_01845 [Treponema sp.]|nr:hypothetical protein [Treponema sp.]